jgi:sugar phosphate permease
VPGSEAGLASGLINTSQQIGGALGLAILAVVASSVTKSGLTDGQTLALASVHGYQQAFLWAAILMVISLIIAIFVIHAPKQAKIGDKQHVPQH